MAKIAICGYGSQGQGVGKDGQGYAYVVDDSVKTQQVIQVISTARNKVTKFATTAKVLHGYKESSVKGKEAEQKAEQNAGAITQSYTGKELGAKGSKARELLYEGADGVKHYKTSEYQKATRAGNIAKYLEQNPNAKDNLSKNASETFASYSSKFMPKGETL